MFQGEAGEVHVDVGEAVLGIAEENTVEAAKRAVAAGRDAAIGGAAVVEIFVGEIDSRIGTERDAGGGINTIALEPDAAAEALAILIDAVDAEAGGRAERLIDIRGETDAALAVGSRGEFAIGLEARPFRDPVDNAAAAAAAEYHRIGAAEYLDPVGIVEVAEILDVVAQAVDKEISGGVVAAQRDLVAISLAGAGHRAGDVGEQVGDRAQRLILDLGFRDDGERLGNVLDLGVRPGRGAGRHHPIFLALAGDDDRLVGRLGGRIRRRSVRAKGGCRKGAAEG